MVKNNIFKILVVDDDKSIRLMISSALKRDHSEVFSLESGEDAVDFVKNNEVHMLITDLNMQGMNGIDLIEKCKKIEPALNTVLVTGFDNVETAVRAIKSGADAYITKPIIVSEFREKIRRILENRRIREENIKLKKKLENKYSFSKFITRSPVIEEIFKKLSMVLNEDTTILITGETGTGKDLLARLIHFNSNREGQEFNTFNPSSCPETLIESELFGHKKGSFTGAYNDNSGAIKRAEGGTLFLDEIGELKLELQVKLLNFLQYKTYTPIGGREESSDVRIIAATNKDLKKLIMEGKFREDLYYRLNVISFNIPPLRKRPEDIYLIAHHYINHFNNVYKKYVRMSPKCYEKLASWDWNGNVRELKNYIEQLVLFSEKDEITGIENIEKKLEEKQENIFYGFPRLEELEETYIKKVLEHTDGNKKKAAEILGISTVTLWRKLKSYQ